MLFPLNWRSAIPRETACRPSRSFNASQAVLQTPGRFSWTKSAVIFSLRFKRFCLRTFGDRYPSEH